MKGYFLNPVYRTEVGQEIRLERRGQDAAAEAQQAGGGRDEAAGCRDTAAEAGQAGGRNEAAGRQDTAAEVGQAGDGNEAAGRRDTAVEASQGGSGRNETAGRQDTAVEAGQGGSGRNETAGSLNTETEAGQAADARFGVGEKRETGIYADARLQCSVMEESLGEGRAALICVWENTSREVLRCQPEIRIRTDFPVSRYLIPGVSVNGNAWGLGKEPKGLSLEGEPWVFDYRRTAIPACTISENRDWYLALFASDESRVSLEASCSMALNEDGTMIHRLLYPCIERPKTYCTRDGYREGHEEFVTLQPGEKLQAKAYVLWGRPVAENFGAAAVEDGALDLLGSSFPARYAPQEIPGLCCAFAKRLLTKVNGRWMFSIGQLPDAEGRFGNCEGYEFGWCGQNGMYARLFLERGLKTGESSLVEIAVSNLDAWSNEAVGRTGLIHTHYHWMLSGERDVEDTCNLGFAIKELSEAWAVAQDKSMEKEKWLQAAESTAEFLVSHYSAEHGFGKAWNVETGECTDASGTIGAYVIPGLTSLWRATGEERWLKAAREACRFYKDRDLARFQCKAGALDTYCIDKESSGPLLAGALALYHIDGSEEWLTCAEMAGWYFCSWMFHHDSIPPEGSDFARYGYRTLGGTSVSAQHHHLDPWGALVVPEMYQLWKITGDVHWRRRGELPWANAVQNMAPEAGKRIHGLLREAGAQNEGYHHCHWGESGAPGYINEWLVAWPQAFLWNAAERLCGESGFPSFPKA